VAQGVEVTRREALELLAAAPLAARAAVQTASQPGRRIFSNGSEMYVIESDGSVKAWSYTTPPKGYFGLGSAERAPQYTAFDVPELKGALTLACGYNVTYALIPDGRVLAWGANFRGEVGNTPRSELEVTARARGDVYTPTSVLGITDAIAIASTYQHAVVATRRGTVMTWGYNLDGQLGVDPKPVIQFKSHTAAAMDYVPFPIEIPGLTGVIGVAAGLQHSFALLKDGTIRAWGVNRSGQLGDGTTIDRKTPVVVTGVRDAVAIATRSGLSVALLTDGTVMTWGIGGAGNAGVRRKAVKPDTPYPVPEKVEGVTGVRAIATNGMAVFALTNTGAVISWGDENVGEVGHSTPEVPARIPRLTAVQSMAMAGSSTLCVQTDNTIMTVGLVPVYARLYGGDNFVSPIVIPLVIKNLRNPW
jgi:alpha-tubulin suppressor-like RCC1 family protein